jgi:hypothetical protein
VVGNARLCWWQCNEALAFLFPQQNSAYLLFELTVFLTPVPLPAKLSGNSYAPLMPTLRYDQLDLMKFRSPNTFSTYDEFYIHGLASLLKTR